MKDIPQGLKKFAALCSDLLRNIKMLRKKITTEEFIKRAIRVHGNKYDYSKAEYKKSREKVIIICKVHKKEFFQSPSSHIKGSGCPECGNKSCSEKKMLTTEDFIKRAKNAHGDKYDYSKVEYRGSNNNVKIICRVHGETYQQPSNHILGKGCRKCADARRAKDQSLTKEEFVEKAKEVHGGNRFDYSKVEYKNCNTKVIIICNACGKEMIQSPRSHTQGNGCENCHRKNQRMGIEEYIRRSKEIHGEDTFDYSFVEYVNNSTKVKIGCKKYGHGFWMQTPNNNLCGYGCPLCRSKKEGEVKELLSKYFKDWIIISHKKIWHTYKDYNHKRYCDFWLEKNGIRIIVEYDGEQHYKPIQFGGISLKKAEKEFKHTQLKDALDAEFCEENNIILYRIKYDEDKELSVKRLLKKVS